MEEVMDKGYNRELGAFIQSYEANEVLDSAVLIAPLVFFVAPTDPRFLGTLDRILLPPEQGGLTSTGLVYRYNSAKSDDGESINSRTSLAGKPRYQYLDAAIPGLVKCYSR